MRRILIAPVLALAFLAPACGTEAAGGVGSLVGKVVEQLKGVKDAATAKTAAGALGPIVDKLKSAVEAAKKTGEKAAGDAEKKAGDAAKGAGDMAKKAGDAAKKVAGGLGDKVFAPLTEQVKRIMANKDWAAPLKGVMEKLKSFVPGLK